MVQESRSPPHRRPRHPDGGNEGYSGQHRYGGGFRGHDDRNGREYGQRRIDNGWVDRNQDRRSDRNHGYSGRDDRRPDYDERERDRERNMDRERYGKGTRDRNRTGLSRRSASPSRLSRPQLLRSRSRSLSASRSTSAVDKSKPNFAPSGLLAAATNTVKAVDGSSTVLKYNEPPEARKPILGWRLYVFKGSEQVGTSLSSLGLDPLYQKKNYVPELLHIHRQSAYLIGRDKAVADISVDHPSCSKQHAVIQCKLLKLCGTMFISYIAILRPTCQRKR